MRGSKPALVVVFVNLDNAKGMQYALKRVRKVALAHKGKLSFALANLGDSKYDMEDYGLASKSTADVRMGVLHRTAAKVTQGLGLGLGAKVTQGLGLGAKVTQGVRVRVRRHGDPRG